jgi:hypothetical protein
MDMHGRFLLYVSRYSSSNIEGRERDKGGHTLKKKGDWKLSFLGEPAPMMVPSLFEQGLLVTILGPKNVRFELRDAGLV